MPEPVPATDLDEVWAVFDPNLEVDPGSDFYVPREDHHLQRLAFDLKRTPGRLHAFLCGHRGSGKTTELKRLRADPEILERYLPVYVSAHELGTEVVDLTHDALMVEIGMALADEGEKHGMRKALRKALDDWGQTVVKTFLRDEEALAEAGARASAWLAYFRAQLRSRREWKSEQKEILEPKVQDLLGILNRMAQELANRSGKQPLVIVDDLEKGESEAEREMHQRLFREHYSTLVQPRFSLVYTLPIYFRARPESRVPKDQIYAFSALRLYDRQHKHRERPPPVRELPGYRVMRQLVERRLAEPGSLVDEAALEELLLIGGGLFRETVRALREATYFALLRGSRKIEAEDAEKVFHQIKKEYQPLIRGETVKVLKAVLASDEGWVPDVEDYLQSRAVVEYENADLWLDVRYVLKAYVKGLGNGGG